LVEEHGRRCLRWSGFAPVVNCNLAGTRVEVVHEGAAPDARALRLYERQHCLHGYGGVDRTPAAPENIGAGLGCDRIGGNDEWCSSTNGLRSLSRGASGKARACNNAKELL
jgi:hypothetical protein